MDCVSPPADRGWHGRSFHAKASSLLSPHHYKNCRLCSLVNDLYPFLNQFSKVKRQNRNTLFHGKQQERNYSIEGKPHLMRLKQRQYAASSYSVIPDVLGGLIVSSVIRKDRPAIMKNHPLLPNAKNYPIYTGCYPIDSSRYKKHNPNA